VPCFDAKGNLVGYDGIINDITERKEAEESLRASERNRTLILDSCRDMVLALDRSARIVYRNPAFDSMLAELARGRDLPSAETLAEELIPKRLRSRVESYFDRAIAGESFEETIELELGGSRRYLECSFGPILSEGDRIDGASVFIRDLTERTLALKAYDEIVRGIASESGREALEGMAKRLEAWLGAEGVIIGEFAEGGSSLKVHAARLGGAALEGGSLAIAGGPCSRIAGERLCFCPKHGPWVFPESAGPPTL